jgi:hypothetical protein
MKLYQEPWGEYTCNNYYDTCVLDSGQTIRIEFNESWSKRRYYYSVYLVISDKRKSANKTYMKSTGRDGLKGLLWARRKITEFEDFIKNVCQGIPVVIYTTWDDNRRRNIYEYGLQKLGYKMNMIFGQMALSKTIK